MLRHTSLNLPPKIPVDFLSLSRLYHIGILLYEAPAHTANRRLNPWVVSALCRSIRQLLQYSIFEDLRSEATPSVCRKYRLFMSIPSDTLYSKCGYIITIVGSTFRDETNDIVVDTGCALLASPLP